MAPSAYRPTRAKYIPLYYRHGDKRQPPWVRTHVELATLFYLSIGYSHAQIAGIRVCSPTTVSTNIHYMKRRAGVQNTAGLVGAWFRWHIVHSTPDATERPAYCA